MLKVFLIIADNPEVSGLLRRILIEVRFTSEIVLDISQALAKLSTNSESYMAITLDPGIHVLCGRAVGVTDWIQKPINTDRLIKAV